MEQTIARRFWAKVRFTPTCWIWTASQNGRGYGKMNVHGRTTLAHHVLSGLPADGFEYDHVCRNRLCVNPLHTEIVTHKENNARKPKPSSCPQGHERTPENTYSRTACKICVRARQTAYYSRTKK